MLAKLDAEQDNTDYGSRGWQLDKLLRVILRDSQQNDKFLKEVYSWVLNKKRQELRQMKNGASKELWKYWVQYTNLCLTEEILCRKHQIEPNFETVYQMLVGVSKVLELLHDSPTADHFGIEKTYQRTCERFYLPCMRRDVRNWIESYGVDRLLKKERH